MGFFTRLIAGLVAASTLGAGLAGTAGAVDTTGATGDAKGVVKLASDDTTNGTMKTVADENVRYGSLANGDFSYPSFSDIQKNEQEGHADLRTFLKSDDGTLWHNMSATDLSKYGKIGQIPGFDSSRFAWSSTENGSRVELQQDRNTKNTYAEIVAQQDNTSIYQNVSTGNGGVLYKIRLKHASRQSSHADRMQVLVGSDTDHATPVEMIRVTSNGHGDKVGGKSTTITTKVSNTDPRDHGAQWETYEGYYQVPEGQKNTVFMFKSLEGFKEYETLLGNNIGNLVDDIEFSRSYKLTYDANSSDASGQVPSDTAANTVKQAKTSTTGTLRLASDDDVATYAASNLPEQIVNGGFDYPSVPSWTALPESGSNKYNKGKLFATINPGTGKYGSGCAMSTTGRAIPNWNRLNFAWNSTQGDTHYSGGMSCEAGNVELNYDSVHHNQFAELTADQQGTAIYQDVKVTPGTMMKWSLKHSSATSAYVDKMQVMIGEPYKETAQEATRITSENGNKVGEKMTTISTPTTSDRADNKKWDTYSGTYLVPDGVTTVRFTFKSVASAEWYSGNDLDDIEFSRSYKLSYDKNASNATGSVPSNQRGKENTVQPAASKTNGTVKTVADDTSNLSDHLVNGDFEYPGANVLSKNRYDEKDYNWWGVSRKDKMVYDPSHETQWVSLPSTFDSDRFAWDSTEVAGTQNGSSQWHTNEVELQRDSRTGNMYGELCAYQANTSIRQYIRTTPGVLYKVRLKHASLSRDYLDKMQVLIGPDGNEQPVSMTRVESQNGLDATGESTASTTVSTHVSNEMEIKDGQGTPYSSRNHDGQWATYEGVYVATSDVTSFTFKSIDAKAYNLGNLLDDIVFDKAYRLSYDKNATDANGSVPSDETAGATKQAKASTTGTLRLASDDGVAAYAASNLPKQLVNSDFDHDWRNIVGQSKMTDKYNFANVDPAHGDVEISGALNGKGEASKHWVHLNGFDTAKFGWKSNQTDTRVDGRGGIVEIQRSKANDNMYAEITASQANTYLYQDIDTAHSTPTVYTVKLRYSHRNGTVDSNEKIQILVGAPGHEQPVEMTRIASDRGNKVGEKSTTVNAPNTDGWLGSWDTFQGSVEIPAGQPVSRFTFKALGSVDGVTGNLIDDVQFKLAYPLSYDKNASDASGQVPSNEHGRENTVQPAKAKTTGTVKTVADDDSSKSLTVNPGFDVPDYSKLDDGGLHWMYVSPAEGEAWSFYDYINPAQPRHQVAGLSQATFGWQELTGGDYKTTLFELHREKDGNVCADVHGSRTIGQTIDTQAGVAYTVSIRHSGRSKGNAGSVQVLVGPDKDHLRPLEMSRMNVSRTGAKYGDRIGKVGTVITTHSDSVDSTEGDHPAWDHSDDWETYSGTYVATGGKTVFAYRGVDKNGNAVSGTDSAADSVIDDLSFKLAYRLSYDKNAQDATGGVPSSQYGRENTVQPAKAKTTGTVRTVTDKTSDGLTVHDLKNGEIAPVQYGDFKFSTIDGVTADQITDVNGFTVKTNWNPTVENQAYAGTLLGTMYQPNRNGANLVLHHVGQWRDSSGTQRWLNAKITVNGQNLGSLVYYESQHKFLASYGKWDRHTSSRPYMDVTVDFLLDDGSTPQGLRGVTGFTDLDGGTSGYNEGVELVSGFDGAYVRSDAHLARFGTNGWAGITDENENNADAHGMKHYVGATFTGSSFHVRWSVASGQARGSGFQPVDSTIAYRLTYDKNAQDATGSIPSDTAANTTRPAKSETDGKVSDLVQRTTTHEDGSVTVRTVDQSTDVVSGCQVYYPAGQRITLATLAKDGDCWDSSMLTRPGHTQLGWSQDSQATQAQAEVTMVEGGMTVYAVWVGNPVLTYDTNKPNTWNGQMPSTPASVSVAYNTAAADGSGWQSGDTSKIRGYRFLGWYAGPQDDAGLYDWNTPLTGNVTVYAHWERLKANVVYDRNAKDAKGSHANTTGWQYSDVTVPSDTSKSFKRAGYVFLGWDTQADGNGTAYKDGSQVPLQDKDITLYAQWQPVFEQFTPTGGVSLPLLVAGGVTLLVMGIGSTVMLTRRMRGEQ
ncbi:InlB B-repeat-containing protein [Bifidobacterium pseudocatenulatum]|uniref:InlB B-repeat-containing protein n=1 Tax=Bifidobacterium pseudocatenulatum TaxID=28026 RepID=UPI001D00714A|nr:InlB B-repeat-containing protein [Bifidobacterium pseudocatenulatum]UDG91075.1 InlB B-repeat-containing protein [Bifidobacterium pseudocatenulatum]